MKCPFCDRDEFECAATQCTYVKRYRPDIVTVYHDDPSCTGSLTVEKPRGVMPHKIKGDNMADRIIVLNGVTYFSGEYVDEMRAREAAILEAAKPVEKAVESNASVIASGLVRTTIGNFLRLDLVEEGRTPGCAPNVLFSPGDRIAIRRVEKKD